LHSPVTDNARSPATIRKTSFSIDCHNNVTTPPGQTDSVLRKND
jgi:hypothetical protein